MLAVLVEPELELAEAAAMMMVVVLAEPELEVAEAATMVMMAVLAAAMTMAPVVRTCSAVFCVCMRFVWNHMSACDMYALHLLVIILLIVF